jgi:hypothetical protein
LNSLSPTNLPHLAGNSLTVSDYLSQCLRNLHFEAYLADV